jgi:SpoVG
MKIKKVEVVPVKPNNGLIGFAHLLFEEGLYLGSIGIFRKLDGGGFRLTYPNRKVGDKEITIFHPTTQDCSRNFEEHIFEAVKRFM